MNILYNLAAYNTYKTTFKVIILIKVLLNTEVKVVHHQHYSENCSLRAIWWKTLHVFPVVDSIVMRHNIFH